LATLQDPNTRWTETGTNQLGYSSALFLGGLTQLLVGMWGEHSSEQALHHPSFLCGVLLFNESPAHLHHQIQECYIIEVPCAVKVTLADKVLGS